MTMTIEKSSVMFGKKYKSVILENWEYLPEIFLTSSTKHIGKENILYYINKLNSDINQK